MSHTTNQARSRAATAQRTSIALRWGSIALVLAILAMLIVIKLTASHTGGAAAPATQPASAALAREVTEIPSKVFDTVGVTAPASSLAVPIKIADQPELKGTSTSGTQVPEVLYFGANWCPFCAAERWALAASLSRFGTFHHLWITSSTLSDVFPGTPTLSFERVRYASRYLAFDPVERSTNISSPAGGYTSLMVPTSAESAEVKRYDAAAFVGRQAAGSIPFISIANHYLVSGAGYSPSILAGLTRTQIADNLRDPHNPVTQAIVATSNYLSATICDATGNNPGSVCSSPGVHAAQASMARTR